MNILLTSVGRRTYLVDYFKKELEGKGALHVSNSCYTQAMLRSDGHLITPLIYDDDYISSIIDYCKKNDIHTVISVFDIDLLVLSSNTDEFTKNGIRLILAPEDSIRICNDKWLTYQFLCDNRIKTPLSFISLVAAKNALADGSLQFPLILKPRWGMASMGVYVATNVNELEVFYNKINKDVFDSHLKYESSLTAEYPVIIQEKIIGDEFGLDVLNDLSGNYVGVYSKQKVAMRAGETDVGLTVSSEPFSDYAIKLAELIRHSGILSVDCFITEGEVSVIEMNCRISGHYPIAYLAGFNFPRILVDWLSGDIPDPQHFSFKQGLTVVKELLPVILPVQS